VIAIGERVMKKNLPRIEAARSAFDAHRKAG
jgi:hypothetical protein